MIPPYFLQVTIGLYIIQIAFILTKALVVVDSGEDKLKEKYELSRNLRIGLALYLITALLAIVILSALAFLVLTQL